MFFVPHRKLPLNRRNTKLRTDILINHKRTSMTGTEKINTEIKRVFVKSNNSHSTVRFLILDLCNTK